MNFIAKQYNTDGFHTGETRMFNHTCLSNAVKFVALTDDSVEWNPETGLVKLSNGNYWLVESVPEEKTFTRAEVLELLNDMAIRCIRGFFISDYDLEKLEQLAKEELTVFIKANNL